MISKNKSKATPAPVAEETQGSNGGMNGATGANGASESQSADWDYALIGKLSHTVHSFDELVSALYAKEGFERSRSAVAQTVRRMHQVATNAKRPLPNLLNPEVIPNARPRINWEGIAAEVGGSVEA